MLEYEIGGHRVRCGETAEGERTWTCDCSAFDRRRRFYGDGFCEHTVAALQRAVETGAIEEA